MSKWWAGQEGLVQSVRAASEEGKNRVWEDDVGWYVASDTEEDGCSDGKGRSMYAPSVVHKVTFAAGRFIQSTYAAFRLAQFQFSPAYIHLHMHGWVWRTFIQGRGNDTQEFLNDSPEIFFDGTEHRRQSHGDTVRVDDFHTYV